MTYQLYRFQVCLCIHIKFNYKNPNSNIKLTIENMSGIILKISFFSSTYDLCTLFHRVGFTQYNKPHPMNSTSINPNIVKSTCTPTNVFDSVGSVPVNMQITNCIHPNRTKDSTKLNCNAPQI